MAESNLQDNPFRALAVAFTVALVCALFVSIAAITLRPAYEANLEAERVSRLQSILVALGDENGHISPTDIEPRIVELESGLYASEIDINNFDAQRAATTPGQSITLSKEQDIAGIQRRANHALVYIVRPDEETPGLVILPVHGVGYQSALYGYLALAADATRILALKFYQQGETPGLGSRIQDSKWEALWAGKTAFNDREEVVIEVRGNQGSSETHVDAISGATRTSQGVNALVRFWLGDLGFGPYLKHVRRGGI